MSDYPLLAKHGLTIVPDSPILPEHVERHGLWKVLRRLGLYEKYQRASNGWTQTLMGPYPWDVEKFLARHAKR